MAKSTLDFIDRLNVKVLSGDRKLSKDDCGRAFILNSASGHTLTLPTVGEAGEGWHATFVVEASQTNLVDRALSSVVAQAGDTIALQRFKAAAGAVSDTGVAAADIPALAFNAGGNGPAADNDKFTLTVGTAAGGTGTSFEFEIVGNGAEFNATVATAAKFFINDDGTQADIAEKVRKAIAGVEDAAGVRAPASGEGSVGTGIQGRFTVARDGNDVEFTLLVPGVAPAQAITMADGVADGDICPHANVQAAQALAGTAGANQTAFVLNGQNVEIHPSGTNAGDRVEIELVGGAWRAVSTQAS
ncbi:MAG: hypothetical protein CMC82_00570 [Flavobacteriaceae bacterium]|nr:hypothetical protein [Flavobacteriaceae bacterium]